MKSTTHAATTKQGGFTLVETMFIVLLIGLLATLAIPGFVRNRESSQAAICRDNLRLIHSAIQQHALSQGSTNVPSITDPEIGVYFQRGAAPTNCPTGVLYVMPNTGNDVPTCPIGYPHIFPWDNSTGL